jgi:Tol biopolymer transport system component
VLVSHVATVLVLFVLACHGGAAPVTSPQPERACAPALPLLASQHTPNVTRLYLAPLTASAGSIQVGTPALMTPKRGFVHQPAFAPDGSGLYFTWRPARSQADIWFHDLRSGEEHPVTCTSEEEYAASVTPDRTALSVIRVGKDLSRTLAVLGLDGAPRRTLLPSLTLVSAYRWADDHTLAVFVSGPDGASRLVLGDATTGRVDTVAEPVGAALAAIPGTRAISYLVQSDQDRINLMSVDVASRATKKLLELPEGVDHVAWLSDGSVLVASGTRILRAMPPGAAAPSSAPPAWQEVADLAGKLEGTIARLVVSDDQRRLAIVAHVDPPS